MKLLIIISLIFFTYQFSLADNQGDSLDVKKNKEINKVESPPGSSKKIGDKNVSLFKKGKKKMDVFIDKDGDGICDQRASGMGFDKMRKRNRAGKQGSGKGNGNGGPGGRGN